MQARDGQACAPAARTRGVGLKDGAGLTRARQKPIRVLRGHSPPPPRPCVCGLMGLLQVPAFCILVAPGPILQRSRPTRASDTRLCPPAAGAGVFFLSSAEGEQISFLFDCIVRGISPTKGPFGLRPVLPGACGRVARWGGAGAARSVSRVGWAAIRAGCLQGGVTLPGSRGDSSHPHCPPSTGRRPGDARGTGPPVGTHMLWGTRWGTKRP